MIAVIMCGGIASRMQQGGIEKPLLKVDGIAMVERVILALAGSDRFDRILAAISPNTPKTKELLKSKGIETIETPGEGYSHDLSYLLLKLKPQRVMVVPSDIPLLNSQIISEIIDIIGNSSISSSTTRKEKGQAISIILEKGFVERTGAKPSIVLDQYCHSGITIFDTMSVGTEPVEEYYLVMNRKEIALNVNTKEELELAKKLLV
ncbi:MAG: NTP transferase domain-containing protein [Thermoproteota archaeon]|nr:NTP transferase domain-containing protein [Thermoproteota archaeon]